MLYLASKSTRRKELLRQAKISFRIVPSSFKEKTIRGNPRRTVLENAAGKARRANIKAASGLVLGADTIVFCKGKIFGKPKSKHDAYRMLKCLSGTTHAVYTGIALCNLSTGKIMSRCVKSLVTMRKLSDSEIRTYFSKVNPLDKAGAYAIQEYGDHVVIEIKGSYTNVVGLPVEEFRTLMKHCLINGKAVRQ